MKVDFGFLPGLPGYYRPGDVVEIDNRLFRILEIDGRSLDLRAMGRWDRVLHRLLVWRARFWFWRIGAKRPA